MRDEPVLIIGATGMLGRSLVHAAEDLGIQFEALAGPDEIDITDENSVAAIMELIQPRTVINAAAYTDVDGAESDPQAAHAVNAEAPGRLARACMEHGARLVHFSTDYVFDGDSQRPYLVSHPTAPLNEYGRSKLAGEEAIVATGCDHLILRTSWLFAPHGRNFVATIGALARERPTLKIVNDQHGRPTYGPDLADITFGLLEVCAAGIINAANDGECTWYDFGCAIVELCGLDCEVLPCTTDDFPRPASRPRIGTLDLAELTGLLGTPRHWRDALIDCLDAIARHDDPSLDLDAASAA